MTKASIPETFEWPVLGLVDRNSYRVSDNIVDMRRPQLPARPARICALPQDIVIDAARTALIVIDMQNDFCAPEGWMAGLGADLAGARGLVDPINRTTSLVREQGIPVIWLNWGVRADRLNLSPGTQHPFNPDGRGPGLAGAFSGFAGVHHVLEKNSWGAQVIDALERDAHDIQIDKHRISGFWDTPLDAILRNLNVTTLLFAGVNADHCVLGTLMDANFHGYDTILLEDCTATTSPEFCMQATLHNVRFCFGFTTTSHDLAEGFIDT